VDWCVIVFEVKERAQNQCKKLKILFKEMIAAKVHRDWKANTKPQFLST